MELHRDFRDTIPRFLLDHIEEIAGNASRRQMQRDFTVSVKSDGSLLTDVDITNQQVLLELLGNVALPAPVLGEEEGGSFFEPGVVPEFFWSIDPIDGTKPYSAGFRVSSSIAVGAVYRGKPILGIIAPIGEGTPLATANITGLVHTDTVIRDNDHTHMFGLDITPRVARDDRLWEFTRRLLWRFDYPTNVPSVRSAYDFIEGRTQFFITANAHHWDICAGAALALERGAIVCHCGGKPINWAPTREKFEPVMFVWSERLVPIISAIWHSTAGYTESSL